MNYPNNRFVYAEARQEDASEILEILEDEPFNGRISLMYTRRPNPLASYRLEGDEAIIAVCHDTQNGKIAGFGVCSLRQVYLNGEIEKTGYLTGLRVRREYRKTFRFIPQGYEFILAQCQSKGVKLLYTTILEENTVVQRMLEKKRSFMPQYMPLCGYEVFTCVGGRGSRRDKRRRKLSFRQARLQDVPAIVHFSNEYGKASQFYPAVNSAMLTGALPGLTPESFYLLNDEDGNLLACGALWDQRSYKQYLVNGYSAGFKLFSGISRVLGVIGLPVPVLPQAGEAVKLKMVSFVAVLEQNPEIFAVFFSQIRKAAGRRSLISMGLTENSAWKQVLTALPHLSYKSKVYTVAVGEDQPSFNPENKPIYLECGLL
jgi:hypothetical protein